jgi:SAM-dependent methyltransferase
MVMCHFQDPARALEEVLRVLRPGGRYLFWEHVESLDPDAHDYDDKGNKVIHKHREEPLHYYVRYLCELAFDWEIHSRGGKVQPGEVSVEEGLIRSAGFERVDVESFDLSCLTDEELREKSWHARSLARFMRKHRHIRGVATKAN